jgi:hypothetical protein
MSLGPQLKFRATEEMDQEIKEFVDAQPDPYNKSDFMREAAAHYLVKVKGNSAAPRRDAAGLTARTPVKYSATPNRPSKTRL